MVRIKRPGQPGSAFCMELFAMVYRKQTRALSVGDQEYLEMLQTARRAILLGVQPYKSKWGSRGIIPLAGVWGQSPQRLSSATSSTETH